MLLDELNDIKIVEEERIGKTRHNFRQLSREVCGDVYDIPDENRVIFAYKTLPSKQLLIGGISFQLADEKISTAGSNFDSEFYHMINFLFVKGDYQGLGVGKKLITKAIDIMTSASQRPIRVQSAEKAVGFFQKNGFSIKGDPFESMCSVKLFKVMVNMELDKT